MAKEQGSTDAEDIESQLAQLKVCLLHAFSLENVWEVFENYTVQSIVTLHRQGHQGHVPPFEEVLLHGTPLQAVRCGDLCDLFCSVWSLN